MSPKQHIKTLVASVGRNKQIFPPMPYFYGADPANIKNAVKNFVRDIGPKSIGMYFIIPSTDILSPKSKYCNGFDVQPHNDWTTEILLVNWYLFLSLTRRKISHCFVLSLAVLQIQCAGSHQVMKCHVYHCNISHRISKGHINLADGWNLTN